jgi:ATP adenylyltransferase
MDHLWAPWRLSYVAAPKAPTVEEPCFICEGVHGNDDRAHLVVTRTENCVVILNRFPYNNGHLLIAPRAHKGRLNLMDPTELLETMQTTSRMIELLDELMHPDGFNIGVNLERAAGAGLPGHVHWHVVPRWNGDTNFMPIIADTKVIVQSLESLYDLLAPRLAEKNWVRQS